MGSLAVDRLFSAPADDQTIMSCWDRFMANDRSALSPVRDLIDQSWRRCHNSEVDSSRYQAPPPIVEDQLLQLQEQCRELVDASAPVMTLARDYLDETGTVMVLTDANGIVLRLEGDRSVILRDATENIHLLPGADWSELSCGTNAIGTTLESRSPIQVHSAEHFCFGIKPWTCSACVIRDPFDGSVLGAIDISGLRDSYSRHSLTLVVEAARRIEARIADVETEYRYRLLEHCFWRIPDSSRDHVVILDRSGRPIKANGEVSRILQDLGAPQTAIASATTLGRDWVSEQGCELHTPSWMQPDWLTPVRHQGEWLGTIVIAPRNTRSQTLQPTVTARTRSITRPPAFADVVSKSPALCDAIERTRRAAATSVSILLLGETGVGKELFARNIHQSSPRSDGPFIALNCGGLGRELLTSELFGYAEGAFTGARKGGMIGKIEAADGGTLFLDELGEMPLDVQPLFLRVLEEGEIRRLGETRTRRINFRLIAATNRDLRCEVAEQRFRADLYYRVSVVNVIIPPLRERLNDIPQLIDHLSSQIAARHNLLPRALSEGAVDRLQQHLWPGNIRELRNVIEALQVTAPGPVITEADLPTDLLEALEAAPATAGSEAAPTALEAAERTTILQQLQLCQGNVTATAQALGIAKSTLYVKMRRYGIKSGVAARTD